MIAAHRPDRSPASSRPACSATAVREPLVLTGKPWKKPAAMLAAPMPIISRVPSTSSPRAGRERRRGGDGVGQRDERDPERTADQQARSREPIGGRERREALGRMPTARRRGPRARRRPPRDRQARRRRAPPAPSAASRPSARITTRPSEPDRERRATVSPSATPWTNRGTSSMKPSPSTENPKSFGSWPTRIVRASPFM